MSQTAIIVDSACSLPSQLCKKYNVSFAPVTYSVDDDVNTDPCNDEDAIALFKTAKFGKKYRVVTAAPSTDDFEKSILSKINEGSSHIIVQTVNRTQGETYSNANSAVARIKKNIGDKGVTVRVMDSRTVFAGQGLMAIETIRRLHKEKNEDQARRYMDVLSEKIHTYIIPRDIIVARKRGIERNEHNVSWSKALIAGTLGLHPIICNVNDSSYMPKTIWGFGKAAKAIFEHAIERIDAGLLSPVITVNYAGPLDELKALPGYSELSRVAKEKKLMLIPSVSSITCGVYASVGSLAMATEPHEWD